MKFVGKSLFVVSTMDSFFVDFVLRTYIDTLSLMMRHVGLALCISNIYTFSNIFLTYHELHYSDS